MKKLILKMLILLAISTSVFASSVKAAELSTFSVETNTNTVAPGENIIVNIQFGQDMGKYTVEVEYDENLFEYVSAIGGTGTDNTGTVTVDFLDETDAAPSKLAVVLFKAKENIITTVPTNFSTTATNLSNGDLTEDYDNILLPVINDIIIEPEYKEYKIELEYEGNVIKDESKDMLLTISSALGKNYDQVRIIAEVEMGEKSNVKLLGKNDSGEDFDLIENGFGEPSGDQLGGKDVVKELMLAGIFSEEGSYTVNFKIIDRSDMDNVIAQTAVNIVVENDEIIVKEEEETEAEEVFDEDELEDELEEVPEQIPNAGNTNYVAIITSLTLLFSIFAMLRNKGVEKTKINKNQ